MAEMDRLRVDMEGLPVSNLRVRTWNQLALKLSRCLTWVLYTYTDRFEQDSYAYTPAARPIPMLATAVDLAQLDHNSLAYHLCFTKALRDRNRVSQAVRDALEFAQLYLDRIGRPN